MKDTLSTIKEWLRVLKNKGKICIVMPDKKYGPFGDPGHVSECTAEEFKDILMKIPNIKILEHDTFKNNFSYNTVIEKIQ
jgi:DNA modification methylase